MADPLISVILPVFNGEKYLRAAIDSILSQTMRDFELLVINDGSTDGSRAVVESHYDDRIKLVNNQSNMGLIASLNKGIELARGKYLARMDADDISHRERFEKQVELMEKESADICGSHWLVISEAGKLIEAKIMPLSREAFILFLMYSVPFAHGSVMMRASFVRAHALKYGSVKFAEDYDLWVRFFEKGARFANVNEFLFSYRESAGSLTKKWKKQNAADTKQLRRRFLRANTSACLDAIRTLSWKQENLSLTERVYLLLAGVLIFKTLRRWILIELVRASDARSIGMALLYVFRGI